MIMVLRDSGTSAYGLTFGLKPAGLTILRNQPP
jgi:hypothetical protein